MPNPEQKFVNQRWENIARFMQSGRARGVNNFTLEGPVDHPTEFHTAVCIFPSLGEEEFSVVGYSKEKQYSNALKLYAKVLKLEIPERIKKLQLFSDETVADVLRHIFSLQSMPYIVLGFGTTRDTRQEVALLFSAAGLSPQSALDRIKEHVKIRRAKFN